MPRSVDGCPAASGERLPIKFDPILVYSGERAVLVLVSLHVGHLFAE